MRTPEATSANLFNMCTTVFSMYVNVPVGQAFTAEFAKTAGVMDTLECIADNKRVTNSMPA
jgi:hypothetical protein